MLSKSIKRNFGDEPLEKSAKNFGAWNPVVARIAESASNLLQTHWLVQRSG